METAHHQGTGSETRRILDAWPGVVCEFDSDLHLVYFNTDSQSNFTGFKPSFLEGRSIRDLLINDADKRAMLDSLETVLKTGREVTMERLLSGKDAGLTVRTLCCPVFADDQISGVVTFSHEVQQFTTDDPLREEVFQSMGHAVVRVNNDGTIIFANREMMGLSAKQLEGRVIDDFFQGDDRTLLQAARMRAITDGTPLQFTLMLERSGAPAWFLCMASLYPGASVQQEVLLMFADISAFKGRLAELEEDAFLKDSVLKHLPEGVVTVDISGKVINQNLIARELLGMKATHVRDLEQIELSNSNGALMKTSELPILRALEGNDVACIEVRRRIAGNKMLQYLEVEASAIRDKNGLVAGAVMYVRDISKNAHSRDQLIRANENLDSFVQATAHDLKAPVDNMKNLIHLMDRIKEPEKRAVFEEKLKQSVHKLDDLLGALLELVDVQKNNQNSTEVLDLKEVFEFIAADVEDEIQQTGAVVELQFEDAPQLTFNKAQLRSLFLNLLTNSIKYRDPSRKLMIRVWSESIGNYVVVHFSDNGTGIDLARHERDLFKPFKRLTSKGEGKGIGLNLVKSFVDRNGGEIKVESEKGVGTVFHLFLRQS
ncbi:MAG: PAS domain-containing protein [Flavobacteriales bacterium]|nr:PAS domain-containing protein [Flavobacteriales bacterium]